MRQKFIFHLNEFFIKLHHNLKNDILFMKCFLLLHEFFFFSCSIVIWFMFSVSSVQSKLRSGMNNQESTCSVWLLIKPEQQSHIITHNFDCLKSQICKLIIHISISYLFFFYIQQAKHVSIKYMIYIENYFMAHSHWRFFESKWFSWVCSKMSWQLILFTLAIFQVIFKALQQ